MSRAALEREMMALRATLEPKFRAVMARLTPRTTMMAFTGMSQPGRTCTRGPLSIFGARRGVGCDVAGFSGGEWMGFWVSREGENQEEAYVFDVGGEGEAFVAGEGPHLTGRSGNASDCADQREHDEDDGHDDGACE